MARELVLRVRLNVSWNVLVVEGYLSQIVDATLELVGVIFLILQQIWRSTVRWA